MCFFAFLIGLILGGICYRWCGEEIEEFLSWMFRGGK